MELSVFEFGFTCILECLYNRSVAGWQYNDADKKYQRHSEIQVVVGGGDVVVNIFAVPASNTLMLRS